MIAFFITHGNRLHRGKNLAIQHGELVRRIIEKRMAALLRFKHQRKSRVALDVDLFNRIHLDGNGQRHDTLLLVLFRHE